MELVKINAADYGLEENKAAQIEQAFKPMLEKMTELEKEYNEVIKLESSYETCVTAKELRLKYVKIRTGTAAIHKDMKAFYLAGGRFVDGWKNAQLFASQGIEEKLMNIEKHFENLEKERIEKLQIERTELLKEYFNEDDILPSGLGEMDENIWNNFLVGTKSNYEAKIEAEKKAEEERIEKERKEKIYYERLKIIAPYSDFHPTFELLMETPEDKFQELLKDLISQKKSYDIEQEKIRKENELLKKEADKLAKELQDKKDEEIRLENERLAKIEAEASKGDSEKVKDLISDLTELKTKYSFESKKNKAMFLDVSGLLDKVINHINK